MNDVELLSNRIRMLLYMAVAATFAFATVDIWVGGASLAPLLAIKLAGLAALGSVAIVVRRTRSRRTLVIVTFLATGGIIVAAALSGIVISDPVTTPLICALVCLATAALIPWGPRPQLALATLGLAAIAAIQLAVPTAIFYPALAALLGCVASVPIASELRRRRRISARAQEGEAEVSAILARVGDQLTLEAHLPGTLLPRTCRLVANALGSDVSHTFLFEDDWLVSAAAYGETENEADVYENSRVSRESVCALVARLRAEGAVRLTRADAQAFRAAPPALKHGVNAAIYFPLRRGSEMIGIQSAEYRGPAEALPVSLERLARGVSHLVSLALESARLVQALEASERVKTDFLANMSHELRTPLNVIIGYNDLLLEGAFDPLTAEQSGTLERVQRSARELLELVTTTLELSRSDGRSVQLQLHEVRVDVLLDDLVQEMRAVPRKPGVRLIWNAPKALPAVRTDRRHLKMILKNLIDNAVKFTDRGRVTIEAQEDDGGVLLRVTDTGTGIPAAEIERIFEPFHRSGNPAIQRQDGVGLGLYIVRRLVDGLAGRIDVQSVIDRGSSFTVWVPLQPPASEGSAATEQLAEAG